MMRTAHVRSGIGGVLAAAAFCLAAAPRTASADPKACIHAHATGQRESKAGHLKLASQLFTSCGSDETCPDQLRKECADFLAEVTRTIPTVVFSALDENGKDLVNVRVYAGDELLADGLDGRAVDIDPGRYHLRFVVQGGDTLTSDVVVREGEKQRLVQVRKERPAAVADRAAAPAGDAHGDASASSGPGAAPWVVGGLTVAALGAGAALAVVGSGDKSTLDQCKPNCSSGDRSKYDSAKSMFLGADISFGAAVVGAVVTTYLFLAHPSHHEAPADAKTAKSARNVWFSGSPLPGGGAVGMAGRF
jgi:hypothetical protein